MAGHMFENREMQNRYNESRGGGKEPVATADKEPMDDGEDMKDVVAEHGPAEHIEMHSHHGDHVHKSIHHDAKSAHDHISKAFGEESDGKDAEDHEEPDGDEAMPMGIPGMRE